MKKKMLLPLLTITSSILLVACNDEVEEEIIEYGSGEQKEIVLPEKQEIITGQIVYKEKNIVYVSDNESMIKLGIRIEGSHEMTEEELNNAMLDYMEGRTIKVKADAYTDGKVKELYVDKEDVEIKESKKLKDSNLTIEEAYNQAIVYAYETYDIKTLDNLNIAGHQYNADEFSWKIFITIKEKNSESFNQLEVNVSDFDNNF